MKSYGQSLDRGLGCPQFPEVSTTLVNGTAPGHHVGVLSEGIGKKPEWLGLDVYNRAITGPVSKTLNSAATDSDHIPCALGFGVNDEGYVYITVGGRDIVLPPSIVRRLTPQECELLQGFPLFWTLIPTEKWRKVCREDYDYFVAHGFGGFCRVRTVKGVKRYETCLAPDGPRYKGIGNSWAVNNAQFVFDRIDELDEELERERYFALGADEDDGMEELFK